MGFWQNMIEHRDIVKTVQREHNAFAKRIGKMVKPYHLSRKERNDITRKLGELKKLAFWGEKERRMGLPPDLLAERDYFLLKHAVGTIPGAFYSFMHEMNSRFNQGHTADARWLTLKEKFFKYQAENLTEITQLGNLEKEAICLNATALAQKAAEAVQELNQEEENFGKVVEWLKPENYKNRDWAKEYAADYQLTAELIDYKSGLYLPQGRTALLQAYHLHVKDCGGDEERIKRGIIAAGQYWGKEMGQDIQKKEQSVLENIVQTVQQRKMAAESTTKPVKTPVLDQETRGI